MQVVFAYILLGVWYLTGFIGAAIGIVVQYWAAFFLVIGISIAIVVATKGRDTKRF